MNLTHTSGFCSHSRTKYLPDYIKFTQSRKLAGNLLQIRARVTLLKYNNQSLNRVEFDTHCWTSCFDGFTLQKCDIFNTRNYNTPEWSLERTIKTILQTRAECMKTYFTLLIFCIIQMTNSLTLSHKFFIK